MTRVAAIERIRLQSVLETLLPEHANPLTIQVLVQTPFNIEQCHQELMLRELWIEPPEPRFVAKFCFVCDGTGETSNSKMCHTCRGVGFDLSKRFSALSHLIAFASMDPRVIAQAEQILLQQQHTYKSRAPSEVVWVCDNPQLHEDGEPDEFERDLYALGVANGRFLKCDRVYRDKVATLVFPPLRFGNELPDSAWSEKWSNRAPAS